MPVLQSILANRKPGDLYPLHPEAHKWVKILIINIISWTACLTLCTGSQVVFLDYSQHLGHPTLTLYSEGQNWTATASCLPLPAHKPCAEESFIFSVLIHIKVQVMTRAKRVSSLAFCLIWDGQWLLGLPGSHWGVESPNFPWDSPPAGQPGPRGESAHLSHTMSPNRGCHCMMSAKQGCPPEVMASCCDVVHDALAPQANTMVKNQSPCFQVRETW